jgi:hypothetical protein
MSTQGKPAGRVVTGKIKVQISSSFGPQDLAAAKNPFALMMFVDTDMSMHGYSVIGEAEITAHLFDEQTMIEKKVEALREEAKKTRADAEATCTRIDRKINQLLAITNDPRST